MSTYIRGRVCEVDLDDGIGPKLYLVVSNNNRNHGLRSALAVRLTTTRKPPRPSIVELPPGEQFAGRVLCDDVTTLYEDDHPRAAGAVSAHTMRMVNDGLKAALALD